MKQTGVVRKIDELGRIVLPKEIRRNLGIRDGESLEIFVDEKGVYLQKFSKISDIREISLELCGDIHDFMNINILILDRDKIIASSNEELYGKNIPKMIDNLMEERENYESREKESLFDEEYYYLMRPIIVSTDCLGMVVFYKNCSFEEWEKKYIKFISQIYVRMIEI